MALTVSCPACGGQVVPHAALCGTCGVMLARGSDNRLIAQGRAPVIAAGRRPCPRCLSPVQISDDTCGNCGKRLYNSYRTASRATILVLLILGGTLLVNSFVRRWQGEKAANETGAGNVRTASQINEKRRARETFVAELAQEYDQKQAGITLELSGEDLNVITFTSRKFTRAHADKLMGNEEVMKALRLLGFREACFANLAGQRWTQALKIN